MIREVAETALKYAPLSGPIGILFAITAFITARQQLGKIEKQLRLQNFKDYTKRYQEIMINAPADIFTSDFDFEKVSNKDAYFRYTRAYFDLCFEQWNLNQQKLIHKRDWKGWQNGMQSALRRDALSYAWESISSENAFPADFIKFMNLMARNDYHKS